MEDLAAENVTNACTPPATEQSTDEKHKPDHAEPGFAEAGGISVREETSVRAPVADVRFHADGEEVDVLEIAASRAESHSPYSSVGEQVPIFVAEHSAAEPHGVPHLEEDELLASVVSFMCVEHNGPELLEGEEASAFQPAAPLPQEYRETSLGPAQGGAEPDDGAVKEETDPDPAHEVGSEVAGHDIMMARDQIRDVWDEVTEKPFEFAGEVVEAAGSGDGDGMSENEFSVAIDARRRGGRRRKRGRTSSKVQGTRFPSRKKVDEEVCFICFDGGDLVVCDRRGCPKVYHPSCVNREESYFQSKGQWSCGWHICSKCQKSASYMCYTCTYSLCKACVNEEEFTCVREKKGFCPSCMGTILLMETTENADEKDGIDFNDRSCWEYLFKDYWFELKGKLSMNIDEITKARTASKVCSFDIANGESSDDGRGVSSDRSSACHDEIISSKKKLNLATSTTCEVSGKEGQIEGMSPPEDTSKMRMKMHSRNATVDSSIERGEIQLSTVHQENPLIIKVKKRSRRTVREDTTNNTESEISVCKKSSSRKKLKRKSRRVAEDNLLKDVDKELTTNLEDANWASKELLAFVSHVKNGDKSILAQYDVQELLLDYIKANNLRDPRRRSQIICDKMLLALFGKSRVGHFEMLKLVESHFFNKVSSSASDENQGGDTDPTEMENEDNDLITNRRRITWKRVDSKLQANLYDYAAIDTYNINLMYLRRSLMEELIDDMTTFCEKAFGSFVRIRVTASNQRQEVYRLVQVVGCGKAPEEYKTGKKTTDVMLEIINLDKKEVITIDLISNQDFTEEECKRLRQSIKFGFISRLTVGEVQEKVRVLQAVRVSDHLESEKLRLIHLRDRASEKGRKKEHRECVEKLQLLSTPEEQLKRLNEVPDVHTDSKMDPSYESPEEDGDEDENKEGNPMQSTFKGRELISLRKEGTYNGALKGSNNVIAMGRARHSDDSQSMELHSIVAARASELPSHKIEDEKINIETQIIESKAPAVEPLSDHKEPWRESAVQPEPKLETLPDKVDPQSNASETEKLWHYKDPSGKIQGPFSMVQLRKWSKHFPSNLGIWRKSERQEDSILLTDALAGICYSEGDNVQARADVISDVSALDGFSTQKHDLAIPLNSASCSTHGVPKLTVKLIDHSTSSTESNTVPEVSPCDPSDTRFQNGEASDVKPIVASNAFDSVSPQRSDASTFPKPTPESLQSTYGNSLTQNSGTTFSTSMHPVNAHDQALSQNGEPIHPVPQTISSSNWNLPIDTKDREQSVPYSNSTTMLSSAVATAVNCQNTLPVSSDNSMPFSSPQLSNSTSTLAFQPSNMSWGTGTPEVNNSGWQVPNQFQNLATAVGNLLCGSGVQGGLGATNNLGWGMMAQGNMNMPWGVPLNANNAWGQGLTLPPHGNTPNFVWGTPQGNTVPNDGCRPPAQGNVAPYPFWNSPVQGNSSQNPFFMPTPVVGNMNQHAWGIPNQVNIGAVNTPGVVHENKASAWDSPKESPSNSSLQNDRFRERNFGSRNGDFHGAGSGFGSGMQSRNWMVSGSAERLSRPPLENTVCKYFESGHCKKGTRCNYIHS